jgi:hypothetical protein
MPKPWLKPKALELALALARAASRDNTASPIRIFASADARDQLTLVPRASLAEYIEISPTESALLLTLTSVERSCDGGPEPQGDSVSLAVRVLLPGTGKLTPGSYPILSGEQGEGRARALPTVKLRGRRVELRPGGELELREVDLSPQGSVAGLLKFEFPGDAEHPATRVSGRFSAHFCRISRLRE